MTHRSLPLDPDHLYPGDTFMRTTPTHGTFLWTVLKISSGGFHCATHPIDPIDTVLVPHSPKKVGDLAAADYDLWQ